MRENTDLLTEYVVDHAYFILVLMSGPIASRLVAIRAATKKTARSNIPDAERKGWVFRLLSSLVPRLILRV